MSEQPFARFPAPAKINLFLRITGRRQDGYHELQTVFQFLDWDDTVRLRVRDDGDIRRVSDIPGVPPEADLMVRAARALQALGGCSRGADIGIDKRLPMGGGIGGGSSDAATVLVALNAMWGLHLTLTELATVGAKLGADVPVFVHGHACWAEGIGEKMTFLEVEEVPLLVVIPGPQVPTAEIFSHEDLTRDSTPLTIDGFPSAHGLRNPRQLMSAGNVCEAIAGQLYPQIGECLSWLASLGPTRMSGTGATCFCLLEHDDKPVPPVRDWQLRTVNTLNVSPLAYAVERWQKSSDGV